MKRLLLLITLITSLIACDRNRNTPKDEVSITINGEKEMWIRGEGGKNSVDCVTSGGSDDLVLQAISNDEWLSIVQCGTKMVWFNSRPNDSGAVRRGSITITYGKASCTLDVVQRPIADREFKANSLQGSSYYGQTETSGDLYNYHLALSTDGIDESGFLYSDSEYFFLDLYSTKGADEGYSWWLLPEGEYTSESGSLRLDDSYYVKTDETTATELAIVEAWAMVSKKMIEARLTLEDDTTINLYYRGPLYVEEMTSETLSTLDKHLRIELSTATYLGTIAEDNRCLIYLFEKFDYTTGIYSGDMFQLSLILPDDATDIVGTYRDGNTPGSFIVGRADEDSEGNITLEESWYMKADFTERAPLTDGVIHIEKSETEGYKFSFDVMDDDKHNISGYIYATGQML